MNPPVEEILQTTLEIPVAPFDGKIARLHQLFSAREEKDAKYCLLMEMGGRLPGISPLKKTEDNRVSGCQSRLYLTAELKEGKIFFSAEADALISAGLAALLIEVYSGEAPLTVLSRPPLFLETLGIHSSLSPNRAHGVLQIYLQMKRLALLALKK